MTWLQILLPTIACVVSYIWGRMAGWRQGVHDGWNSALHMVRIEAEKLKAKHEAAARKDES